MALLPHTSGMKNKVLIQKRHHYPYEHVVTIVGTTSGRGWRRARHDRRTARGCARRPTWRPCCIPRISRSSHGVLGLDEVLRDRARARRAACWSMPRVACIRSTCSRATRGAAPTWWRSAPSTSARRNRSAFWREEGADRRRRAAGLRRLRDQRRAPDVWPTLQARPSGDRGGRRRPPGMDVDGPRVAAGHARAAAAGDQRSARGLRRA